MSLLQTPLLCFSSSAPVLDALTASICCGAPRLTINAFEGVGPTSGAVEWTGVNGGAIASAMSHVDKRAWSMQMRKASLRFFFRPCYLRT